MLSRDEILAAEDLATEDVNVPAWDGTVRVRALTAKERDAFEASCMRERPKLDATGKPIPGQMEYTRDPANMRAKLVVRTVVDEAGKRLFKDNDAPLLGEKSASAVDALFDVAARLSGLGESDVGELEGNSEAGPIGSSPSS
jgi:hypothetical protein